MVNPEQFHANSVVIVCAVFTVFAPHVDNQRQRVSDAYRAAHSVSGGTVSVPDFHVTFGRWQREHDRIARSHSAKIEIELIFPVRDLDSVRFPSRTWDESSISVPEPSKTFNQSAVLCNTSNKRLLSRRYVELK